METLNNIQPGICCDCNMKLKNKQHYRCWKCNKGVMCNRLTKNNTPCKIYLKVDELFYCKYHIHEKKPVRLCGATKRNGETCKWVLNDDEDMCNYHANTHPRYVDSEEDEAPHYEKLLNQQFAFTEE